MIPENGSVPVNSEGESCHCGKLHLPFALAATLGAPQAIQVADRWHLVQNLANALQVLLARYRPEIRLSRDDTETNVIETLSHAWCPFPRAFKGTGTIGATSTATRQL